MTCSRFIHSCFLTLIMALPGISQAGPFDPLVDLDLLQASGGGDGSEGFQITGCSQAITFGGGVGDINNDSFDDLVVHCRTDNIVGVIFGSDAGFPADVDLGALDGSNGFAISDISLGFYDRNTSTSGVGDINDDGIADLAVGDPMRRSVYIIYGSDSPFPALIDVTTPVAAPVGFTITEGTGAGIMPTRVIPAGDLNNDGIDDLALSDAEGDGGGPRAEAGRVHALFGSGTGFADTISLDNLDGTNGFTLLGAGLNFHLGRSVSAAGDFDGDGFDDLIVGSPDADSNVGNGFLTRGGQAHIVFGRDGNFPATIDLWDVSLPARERLTFEGDDDFAQTGWTVAGIGDVNLDGFDDVAIGTPYWNPPDPNIGQGAGYVVFGDAEYAGGTILSRFLSVPAVDRLMRIEGDPDSVLYGYWVAGNGDVNGDGISDMVLAELADSGDLPRRNTYFVIYGQAATFPAIFNTQDLDGDNGFQMISRGTGTYFNNVDVTQDINNDGISEIIVSDENSVFVLYGKSDGAIIRPISDQIIDANTTLGPLEIRVIGLDAAELPLVVTASSSDTALVPQSGIDVTSSAFGFDLTLTPAADSFGDTTITVSATGAQGANLETMFQLSVLIVDTDGDGDPDWSDPFPNDPTNGAGNNPPPPPPPPPPAPAASSGGGTSGPMTLFALFAALIAFSRRKGICF